MNRKTLCIVIALMVLSISALLVANPNILGGFSSTLNGVPVEVTISLQGNGTITTMSTEDLVENAANIDYGEQFVRFMGVVESIDRRESKKVVLRLDGPDFELTPDTPDEEHDELYVTLSVHPLDSPHLPTEYQEGHVYEFTGFLTRYTNVVFLGRPPIHELYILAFEVRHHGPQSAAEQAARLLEGD